MSELTASQTIERGSTREELLMTSESCLISWLVLVTTWLVDCCSKCLQQEDGMDRLLDRLTERLK